MNAITLTINPTNDYRAAMQQAALTFLFRREGLHLSGDHQVLQNCSPATVDCCCNQPR